jgi:Ca2+-transporting ATPase
MTTLTAEQRSAWLRRTADLATGGHKVIACAERLLAPDVWSGGEPEGGYTLLGILAFEDPIREGAASAVASARTAGIHVIMVTGDHPATARAVAGELGLGGNAPRIVEGNDLDALLENSRAQELNEIDVIARAAPAQKLGLVRALQRSGEIVAVTGDGVNDVPALQGADVGIAMGERGTRSAREVAAIVLLDDNFRTIVRAIAEGRQLFRNLRLSFAYLLMVHIPLVLTAALIPFAGFPLLYLPAHIVWLELIIHPTAIFAFQQAVSTDTLTAADHPTKARFFDRRDWLLIGGVGTLLTAALSAGYLWSSGPAETVEHARAMAIAVLVIGSAAVTLGLSRLRGVAASSVAAASALSAVVLIQVPQTARLLHLEPLHTDDWLAVGVSGVAAGLFSAAFLRRRA